MLAVRRGLLDSIHNNGEIAWYFVDPFTDNLWYTLDVRFPNGKIVTTRVAMLLNESRYRVRETVWWLFTTMYEV